MTPGEAVIVGAGQSAYGRGLPGTAWELALDAILAALADAGLEPGDIDGVCRFVSPFEHVTIPQVVSALGIPELSFFAESPLGGEAIGSVFGQAAAAVTTGRANAVLVYRALSQSRTGRFGRADAGADPGSEDAAADVVAPEAGNLALSWPHGFMSPGQQFALTATRYMHDNRIDVDRLGDALAAVALAQRAYGHANPHAIMRERPLTRDDYDAARMISWPLRLFDYCLENDGAVAFVVTRADRCPPDARPVSILATSQSLSPYQEPLGLYGADLNLPFPPGAARRLFERAGLDPGRVRVAELYDACSLMPVRSLEAYGFVADGQGWRHVIEAGIGPDSPLPVNTHGGHLSEAYIHGMNGVLEAVRQVRGEASTQIPGADVALVGAPAGGAVILAEGPC